MQQGNLAEAAKYYAEASKAFPASTDANSPNAGVQAFLTAQNSVLTLARGEYVDALKQLYPYAATFWGDAAYIGERVLTVDELKTFVDTHLDTQVQPVVSLANLPAPFGDRNADAYTHFYFGDGRDAADHLRDLLARRLVRVGRYQEALKYAPALEVKPSTPAAMPTVSTHVAALAISQAQSGSKSGVVAKSRRHRPRRDFSEPPNDAIAQYVQALNDANAARSDVDRARGLYRAAAMVGNGSGNKIMGTEGPPDSYADPWVRGGTGQFQVPPMIL